jgi:hypothetical protein
MTISLSRTADIRRLAKTDEAAAITALAGLLRELFGMDARDIAINHDQYSLNSLNGFFEADGQAFFFKFHQEEGEEAMSGEYYRAEILARTGLPVDQPVHMSALPGEQILIYRRRSDPRFSDVLRALDLAPDQQAEAVAIAAEKQLSGKLLAVYRRTLHPITPEQAGNEPIHRLFHERLIDLPAGTFPGGRLRNFYLDRSFAFPGVELDWQALSTARMVINGIAYRQTIGDLFTQAHARLRPDRLAEAGGVVAHGDAHNANVWYTSTADGAELSYFDPAFAGEHVPTLLAEVKTTFHNILAHPLWLYDAAEAVARYSGQARYADGTLHLDTDWQSNRIRKALLDTKAEHLWRPLLAELKSSNMLPDDWRTVIRLALFLCPTLVMNLRAGATTHNPVSSLIAFSVATMVGSEPESGEDIVSRFLESITPG